MLRAEWEKFLLDQVALTGADGRVAAEYLREKKVKIGFRRARSAVGAFWSLSGNIFLNDRYYTKKNDLTDPYLLSLVVHESRHLQQGIIKALSVYGELDAWQVGFRVFKEITGCYPAHPAVEELMTLTPGWDRHILQRARILMRMYAGVGYRIDLLPLFPLPDEIRFRLFGIFPR